MPRGRKPKPTKLKQLAGNPGKRALNAKEPVPVSKIPKCPAHLDAEGKREWKRITVELAALGLIGEVDRAALAACCSAWSDFVKASKMVTGKKAVTTNQFGAPIRNPWQMIKRQALDQVMRFYAEFGMTPSSRSRVQSDLPTPDDDLTGMLFKGKRVKVTK